MKKFGIKILLFTIPLVVTIVIFDFYLRNINSLYKEKEKGLITAKNSIEILILGNSHANYNVDTNQFNLIAYNLANVNQSLYFDKRLTLKYLDILPKLKYVLISIDYHSLFVSSQENRDYWSYYGNGVKYKNKSYLLQEVSPFLFGYTPKVSISILKTHIINLLKYKNKNAVDFNIEEGVNPLDSISKGFMGYEGINEHRLQENIIEARVLFFDQRIKNGVNEHEDIVSDLEDLIKILKSKGITPVLFSNPGYSEFNTNLNQEVIINNRKIINELQDKFELKYLDYSNGDMFSNSDFYDHDHLNKKGAAKFGRILSAEILKME